LRQDDDDAGLDGLWSGRRGNVIDGDFNAAHIWLDGKRNLKRPSQEFLLPCETVFSCESRSQSRNLMRSGSALAAPLKNH
jgi:hypothetical protein